VKLKKKIRKSGRRTWKRNRGQERGRDFPTWGRQRPLFTEKEETGDIKGELVVTGESKNLFKKTTKKEKNWKGGGVKR